MTSFVIYEIKEEWCANQPGEDINIKVPLASRRASHRKSNVIRNTYFILKLIDWVCARILYK